MSSEINSSNFIRNIIIDDLESGKHKEIITRFPPEPNGIDGSLLHAIERIYPFIVQQAGYYPAVAMTEEFAAIEYQNLHHYVQGYNRVMVGNGVGPYYKQMMGEMNYIMVMQHSCKYLIKKLIKNILKKILPLSFLKAVKKKVKKEDK